MVSRFISAVQKKYSSVTEAAFVISFFTLMSQLLGVVRDRLFSYYIGPGINLDVYLAAFRIPDFLYVILSTLISATILIPLLSKSDDSEGDKINTIFSFFILATVVLSVITMLLMPWIAHFIAPGFSDYDTHRLVILSRIMLLSPIILGISNFIGSVNQYYKKFFGYAMAPVMYNVGIIIGIVFFYRFFGIMGLGFGVLAGAFLHFLTQIIVYSSSSYKLTFIKISDFSFIKEILKISIPRTATLSLSALLFIIMISIMSYLKPGTISLTTFALNIASVPLGLIGVPFATASFPYLVTLFKNKDKETEFVIEETLQKIIFWTFISVGVFMVFRAHIVRIILGTKLFTWQDTSITAALVMIFLIGIIFQALNQFFIRIYYAANNTKKPLYISLFGFFVTILLLILFKFTIPSSFVIPETIARIVHVPTDSLMILLFCFVYSIGMFFTFCLFVFHYIKDFKHSLTRFLFKQIGYGILHASILAVLCKFFLYIFADFTTSKTLIGILVQGALSGMFGLIVWIVYLLIIKNEHVEFINKATKKFFSSHKVILEETQDL